jgi:acetyl-CoA carboxylase carboxyl transferase subunit alpha
MQYLDFEKELEELDSSLDVLKNPFENTGLSSLKNDEIKKIQNEIDIKTSEIYNNLDGWQKTKVARHDGRPKSDFYIKNIFENFQPISGDRLFGEDEAIIAGFAKLENQSILVLGQEKGSDTESRLKRNFGMMRPEGYRKCIRLMKLAEKFKIPVITFVDTPGAYPGKGAEERGQAEAIAKSIDCCLSISQPIISVVIGEGGSGGAIAIATSNRVLMLEHAIYSVISPEGCASILWKDASKSKEAAESMQITAQSLLNHKIIDGIIKEPLGGAHRNPEEAATSIKQSLIENLRLFSEKSSAEIIDDRKNKFLSIGSQLPEEIGAFDHKNVIHFSKDKFIKNKKTFITMGFVAIALFAVWFLY